jgi:hypothetical protein
MLKKKILEGLNSYQAYQSSIIHNLETYLWNQYDFKEAQTILGKMKQIVHVVGNVSDLISIGGLHTKLWDSKVTIVLILRISGLPLGSPGTK